MALSRGARFILTFIMLSVLVSLGGVLAMYFLATRGPDVQSGSVLWLQVPSGLIEHAPDDLVGQLTVGRRETLSDVVGALRKAKLDDRVQGVILMPPLGAGLWAKAQEIRDAMLDFRESGKPLIAYLEYGGGQQYYLATAADRIFLTPTSPLDLVGVASYELFLREAMDKVGTYPDYLHAGEFKTASNIYTETTFTPEHREMSESLNRDFYEQLVGAIVEGRHMSESAVRRAIDAGPFVPDEAVAQGLIDGLRYEDELAAELDSGDAEPARLDYADYRRLDPATLGLSGGPRVAVIHASGVITLGGRGYDIVGSQIVGSAAMARDIRAAREDDTIKAIVVRIDSPGGAAIASDLIWRELKLATDDKPLIASMSDVAASGGYYIAAPADVVVAQPGTLTGSIGVVGGKFAIGGTLEKFGVHVEAVTDGAMSDMNSPFTPYSDQTRVRVQEQIDTIYETFLARVAEGRDMTRDEVHAIAQGRVWTGRQAQTVGLVDELGGFDRALAAAKREAGIEPDRDVTVVRYPRPRSFFDVINSEFGARALLAPYLATPADRLAAVATLPMRLFRPGEPLALMPMLPLPH